MILFKKPLSNRGTPVFRIELKVKITMVSSGTSSLITTVNIKKWSTYLENIGIFFWWIGCWAQYCQKHQGLHYIYASTQLWRRNSDGSDDLHRASTSSAKLHLQKAHISGNCFLKTQFWGSSGGRHFWHRRDVTSWPKPLVVGTKPCSGADSTQREFTLMPSVDM